MASQKESMTEALGNMLFKIKDKLGDDEYKKMYDLVGEIHNEKSKPYYRVVWLKLKRDFDGEVARHARWTHVKTVSIVNDCKGYNGQTADEVFDACAYINERKMGDPCMVNDTGALYFYNEDSEYEDGKIFFINEQPRSPMITEGYFISIEKL